MSTINGVIETSSGDLLRYGATTFVLGAGESAAPTPFPATMRRKWQKAQANMSRWNGSAWVEVTNPTREDMEIKVTISGGAITIPSRKRKTLLVVVDTEASASTDNLDAILGGVIGTVVILRSKADARNVVVRNNKAVGSDKFRLSGGTDFTLETVRDKMMLVRRTANVWDEVDRSTN